MEVPVLWGLMLLAVLPFINAVDNSTLAASNENSTSDTPTSPRPVRSPQNYYSIYSNRLRQPYYRDDSG
ncbi:uncharacterized protein LOC111053828 [Nilaparvata lugens]|uniref:uncharacterized protein LOC111053828 n=1 Tax=Nilaparvata lugens TaxID=108931 RepID=UPI00193DF09B|nr:uncharacterized protein LOC111053828 [Nilaparvata lugens]